jgi:phosphatidylserine synthase
MSRPEDVEVDAGSPTPIGQALAMFPDWHVEIPAWFLPALPLYLPFLGLLMVSRVRYVHVMSLVTRQKSFYGFVALVFVAFLFFAAPIPMLFTFFNAFVLLGVARFVLKERRARRALARGQPAAPGTEERL